MDILSVDSVEGHSHHHTLSLMEISRVMLDPSSTPRNSNPRTR
jgi:hypothetical protein